MEITLTAEQAATLADLTRRHPNVDLTIRQLRDRASILAEFGTECALIKPGTPEEAA